jgi:hypothetical protein
MDDVVSIAQQLYIQYRVRCFWHCKNDLVITEDLIPFVAKGLKKYGGWKGWLEGARLLNEYEKCKPEEGNQASKENDAVKQSEMGGA